MLGEDLKPWLIEVNHSPSWHTETPIDLRIKQHVIQDAMGIVEHSHAVSGRVTRLIPQGGTGKANVSSSSGAGGVEFNFSMASNKTLAAKRSSARKRSASASSPLDSLAETIEGISRCTTLGGFTQIFPSNDLFRESKERSHFLQLIESQGEALSIMKGASSNM